MKKKSGFTLAEILVTLGIIGIVAALTTPSLVGSYQKSKIGPTLRKFMNTIETANQHIMGNEDVDKLSVAATTSEEYMEKLAKYLKGSLGRKDDGSVGTLQDASLDIYNYSGNSSRTPATDIPFYTFATGDAFALDFYDSSTISTNKQYARDSYKGIVATIWYDINGLETKPNRIGKDVFLFYLDNNGTLVPYGGRQYGNAYSNANAQQLWKDSNDNACNETSINIGLACAGSIADNDWKVIYE